MACSLTLPTPLSTACSPHHRSTAIAAVVKPLRSGADTDTALGRHLLSYPDPSSALAFFRSVPFVPTSPFAYNALLRTLSRARAHADVLAAFVLMRRRSVPCDRFSLPLALRAASALRLLPLGLHFHALAVKTRLSDLLSVATVLLDMYCSCGLPDLARQVFDRAFPADVVCWNTMVAGLVKCKRFGDAREVFDAMPERNVSSWNTMIDMYCKVGDVELARRMFDEMDDRDVVSWNTMISGYGRVGACDAARELFDLMPKRNVVSWNVMITSYVHGQRLSEALGLFRAMLRKEEVVPDEVTAVAVLPACANLGALNLGQWVHAYIRRRRVKMDVFVAAALVDMYGKCGCINDARRVFDSTNKKDAFLCATMIEVLAMHGRAEEVFEIFERMRREGIVPNDVTFVGLLKACAHVGLVETGLTYFGMMQREFGLFPKVEHYGCMVDLLGRAGHLEMAYELISNMPVEPPAVVLASLVSSCKLHNNVKLAEEVALRLIELEPESCGNYVLLANIYSKANRWEDAVQVRRIMKEKGMAKKPGCSFIEVNNGVHEFFAGDRKHPKRQEIYEMLENMAVRLKREGYEPCTSSALHDVDKNGKEQSLIHHSEKLALAFGLIATDKGATIRIVKNLRICDDCHLFLKLASKCYGRELIVRDCHRFHHFRDGTCSCGDYW